MLDDDDDDDDDAARLSVEPHNIKQSKTDMLAFIAHTASQEKPKVSARSQRD